MKNASVNLENQLRHSAAIKALPQLTVDWNLNRYHDTRVTNSPDEQDAGFDIELFPIETLSEPRRPYKGINKARVSNSTVAREHFDIGGGRDAKFYIADVDDMYKYWTSPLPAENGVVPIFSEENFPPEEYLELTGYDNFTSVRPKVEYGQWDEDKKNFTPGTVKANKIVLKIENTWATPDDFDIVITRESNTQTITDTTISSNQAGWEGPGEIILYWNGFSWSSNRENGPVYDVETNFPEYDEIRAVQLVVRTLRGGYQRTEFGDTLVPTKYVNPKTGIEHNTDGQSAFVDVIEIGAHLEADLTPWLVEVNDAFDMSEVSNLYPIGTVTTNQASLSLSNLYKSDNAVQGIEANDWIPGIFARDNDDEDIIWSDYIEANAEVRLKYTFYDDVGLPYEDVQQFVMYTDSWTGQDTETVTVELSDYSKFFNEENAPSVMWEEKRPAEIVWSLLDAVGFNDYEIDNESDRVVEHTIPVFYTDGEQTIWEVLDELAKGTQTAIYFDGRGKLQVKTRDYALSALAAPVWKLQSYSDSTQKANIVTASETQDFEPNSIKVIYEKTNWAPMKRGQPTMQKVWEPEEESEVLRSTPLVRTLDPGDKFIWVEPKDARIWPFEGLVNIEGELIRYKGKQMAYYTGANGKTKNKTIVNSQDERKSVQRNKATQGYGYKSHWTGALAIAKDEHGDYERGVWNSEEKRHDVQSNYSTRHYINGVRRRGVAGFRQIRRESQAQLKTPKRFKKRKHLLVATRGATGDNAFFHYGTKFKFVKEKGRKHQCAGIVIHNSGVKEDGYYFEFTPTSRLGGKERKKRAELIVYSRIDGKQHRLGKRNLAIAENIEYEVDVTYINIPNSGAHGLQAWVNGKRVFNEVVTGSKRAAPIGRFGMFARGRTKARFEYLYAIRREPKEHADDFSFLDRVQRSYMGGQWDREWVFRWRELRRRARKKWRRERGRFNRYFFDDFGPYVHEVREYDVKFDPTPVLHSRLYMTNDWAAAALNYKATPFGAKFTIANTARANAVIHGEDTASFAGSGSSVNQVLTVLGRVLIKDESEEVLAENAEQVRRRGKNEAELSSPWIQSKAMATSIADWIKDNWSYGNQGLNLEVFGNPLIEVGDVVSVDYPEKHISGDYFVVGVKNAFSSGLTTTLDLRERV